MHSQLSRYRKWPHLGILGRNYDCWLVDVTDGTPIKVVIQEIHLAHLTCLRWFSLVLYHSHYSLQFYYGL